MRGCNLFRTLDLSPISIHGFSVGLRGILFVNAVSMLYLRLMQLYKGEPMTNTSVTDKNMANTKDVRTERGDVEITESNGVTKGYAQVRNARLYFEMAGAGQPLVFLHAGIADHRMWDTQFHAFAEEYRVIRYDARGYGKSTTEDGGAEASEEYVHFHDLYLLLRALEIESATLIGSSMGGSTAIDFALAQPALTHALVLVGAVPGGYEPSGEMPPALQQFIGAYQEQNFSEAAELATQIWFDGPQRDSSEMDSELRAQVQSMMQEVLSSGAVNFNGESAEHPAANRLSEIRVPALVLVGAQDDESVLEASRFLADNIPAADRIKMDGAAHLPNLEQPEQFYEAVKEFLERIETVGQSSDLATGLGGAVERKLVEPDPDEQR